jgi:hypothetical protein
MRVKPAFAALSLLAASQVAQAEEAQPADHRLEVSALTRLPVMVGGGLTWESPQRIRASFSAGAMPGAYVDLTNAAMTGFDIYSETVAEIIDKALRRSLVLHTQVGFRPLPRRGLHLDLGYQALVLGGDSTDLSVFAEATDPRLLERAQDVTGDLEVRVADHMLTAEAGYQWTIRERFLVGTSLGFAYTVASPSTVSATRSPNNAVEEEIIEATTTSTEDYLTYVFEEWVHLPMIGVSVGYRFP